MVDHAHYIAKCKHGLVRFQCRCAAADKRVDMVECDERCPADPTSEIDWIAEAKRIGDYDSDQCGWLADGSPVWEVEVVVSDYFSVTGQGPTEQLAARYAVLRLRALALRVLPEYGEAVELLRWIISTRADWDRSGCLPPLVVQRATHALARIDAKEKP